MSHLCHGHCWKCARSQPATCRGRASWRPAHGQPCLVLTTDSLLTCFGFEDVFVYSSGCELGVVLSNLEASHLYAHSTHGAKTGPAATPDPCSSLRHAYHTSSTQPPSPLCHLRDPAHRPGPGETSVLWPANGLQGLRCGGPQGGRPRLPHRHSLTDALLGKRPPLPTWEELGYSATLSRLTASAK